MKNSFDDLNRAMRVLNQISGQNKILTDFHRSTFAMIGESRMANLAVSRVIDENIRLLSATNSLIAKDPLIMEAVSAKWSAVAAIAGAYETPALARLHESLYTRNPYAFSDYISSITLSKICAPDLAVLKAFEHTQIISSMYPKGLSSAIRGVHVGTISRISKSNKLTFNADRKEFYITAEPEQTATIPETNIICSGIELLAELKEDELVRFQSYISECPSMAVAHEVGRRIKEIISTWNESVDFDRDVYYHGRGLKDGDCPYTNSGLRQAPYGVTGQGRYNFAGQSRYYFSDKKKGVMAEIKKHSDATKIQIVKLKPREHVRMLDLSMQITKPNKFLDFCRYVPDYSKYSQMRSEYLIPSFVADCCYSSNIDGIKYYGSKEYTNYVTWDDRHFDFLRIDEIIPVVKLSEITE